MAARVTAAPREALGPATSAPRDEFIGGALRFPTLTDVELAAATLPRLNTKPDPTSGGLRRRFALRLAPGLVQLVTTAIGDDRRPSGDLDGPRLRFHEEYAEVEDEPIVWTPRDVDALVVGGQLRRSCDGCPLVTAPVGGSKRRILMWSAKSRANMAKTMASLDWTPVVEAAGARPAMVTLTYPGDWEALAPDGATAKRHLQALYKRFAREYGREATGTWKQEFQERGAPHFHLYFAVPYGDTFARWLSDSWAQIIWGANYVDHGKATWLSGDNRCMCEVCKSRRAGTGIDWREGIRALDPKRLAIYFAKRAIAHNSARSKEYQHIVPAAWREEGKGPGRFWGYRGFPRVEGRRSRKATTDVELDRDQFVQLRRLARRWVRAAAVHRPSCPRSTDAKAACLGHLGCGARERKRHRQVVDVDTGEVQHVELRPGRYDVRSLAKSRFAGGFLLVNDAPRWLEQASRWTALDGRVVGDGLWREQLRSLSRSGSAICRAPVGVALG